MIMNDEQISELIYQCRKAKIRVETVDSMIKNLREYSGQQP